MESQLNITGNFFFLQFDFKYGVCHSVMGELKIEKMKTAWLVITSIMSLRKYFRNIKLNGWGFRKT